MFNGLAAPMSAGFKVVENANMTKEIQYKFCKSKKKRIRKKFARRYKRHVPLEKAFVDKVNNVIHIHPALSYILEKSLMDVDISFVPKKKKENFEYQTQFGIKPYNGSLIGSTLCT